jgi:uncharacterized membrane protein YjjP (DUF1212 family)
MDNSATVAWGNATPANGTKDPNYGSVLPDEDTDRTRQRGSRPSLKKTLASRHVTHSRTHRLNRKDYMPTTTFNPLAWTKWLIFGSAGHEAPEHEVSERFTSLARMLCLLREYEERFGIPEHGGPPEQQMVLKDLVTRLYASGAPIWVLESVMPLAGHGLTGSPDVEFLLLPKNGFIFAPGASRTVMFRTNRGYDMYKLDLVEMVTVRLASFASNTNSVSSVAHDFPAAAKFRRWYEQSQSLEKAAHPRSREELAEEILNLGSEGAGLFFFTSAIEAERKEGNDDFGDRHTEKFWEVENSIKDIFSRLAALEAKESIAKIDEQCKKPLYPMWAIILFRIVSSGGAAAFWFGGSWVDMIVAGCLAVVVAYVGDITSATRQERMLSEVISSLIVGIVSGLVALRWPDQACFGAIAVGAVLDILQGFRVMYAVVLVMSKNTMTGAADCLESILFTGLISYFLKFGQAIAEYILGHEGEEGWTCDNGINQWWYFLLVPLASLSWSGLFSPYYTDLPVMMIHGVIAYVVYSAVAAKTDNDYVSNFASAAAITFSAGICSRISGRQALGNAVAGLYVLTPGAYFVKQLFGGQDSGFIEKIAMNCVVIGLGAWTGTLLCSPTLLGTSTGILQQAGGKRPRHERGRGALLYF